jgi:hypothetical protein
MALQWNASFEAIYESAARTPMTYAAYEALVAELPASDRELDELIGLLVHRGSRRALMPVLLAALHAGRVVDGKHLGKGARLMEEDMLIPSVALRCAGDVASPLLAAAGSQNTPERERCSCLLSAAWCQLSQGSDDGSPGVSQTSVALSRLLDEVENEENRQILAAASLLLVEAGHPSPWPELESSPLRRMKRMANQHLDNVRKYTNQPILEPLREAETRAPRTPEERQRKKDGSKLSRNDPCPCGSGKKFKRCCL